ncbi:hypothetical protein ACSBR1_001065 [Camellia fascicularis]
MLRSLINLDLLENNLTGLVPTSIGNLVTLTVLHLFKNHHFGSIPQDVRMLRFGPYFYRELGHLNRFTPFQKPYFWTHPSRSSISNSIGNLSILYFYENQLSGSIPQDIGMLRSLIELDLLTNNLIGSIPAFIANLTNLTILYLNENQLSRSIPQDVGMLRSLIELDLLTNNLTGLIPASIGNLTNLTILYLYENQFSGSIPQDVGMLRSLIELSLSTDNLIGSIPASIGNLANLTILYLYNKPTFRSNPQDVGMLRFLIELDLSTNNITGSIPTSIGNLANLTTLYLHKNRLSSHKMSPTCLSISPFFSVCLSLSPKHPPHHIFVFRSGLCRLRSRLCHYLISGCFASSPWWI